MDRREFLKISAMAGAAGLVGFGPDAARAKAPFAAAQAPSFYRFKAGSAEITAITDGTIELPLDLFASADREQAKALLSKARRAEKVPTVINAYVINTGDKLILVDTGFGNKAADNAGMLIPNLKAAGFEPAQFDAVVITHMHPDHVGGLQTSEGRPVFSNATLLVGDAEHAFWTDEGIASRAPADAQTFFRLAQAAIKPYAKQTQLFKNGEQLAPGIIAEAAAGHTPGHSMIRVDAGKEQLLIWGDIVHVAALQFPMPQWAIAFDSDQAQAIETRKKLFDRLASDGTMVAGMHLDFPGLGYVSRDGQGYSFARAVWSTKL